jgi:hypothetical protein
MKKSGTLSINGNESRLDDGTLLARCAASDPLASGTAFLKNKNLQDGDQIWVTGNNGTVGNVAVFCMDDAGRQVPSAMPAEVRFRASREAKKKPAIPKASKRKRAKKSPVKTRNRKRGKRS